jgi:hypothetical protein
MQPKLRWAVALWAVGLGLELGCSASMHGDAAGSGGAPWSVL